MIFYPAIIGLFLESILMLFMVIYCAWYAVQILRHWDIRSGSEKQLLLERRTYLISVFLSCIFVFEILSLFLFVYTVDRLHPFFVGAMCAAGSLYANAYGYPALVLKVIIFFLAGLWLILNYIDNRAIDYPLIRIKYIFLLVLMPLLVTESVLQAAYFINLKPNIITSCCGTLFSTEGAGINRDLWHLPGSLMRYIFFASAAAALTSGLYYYRTGKAAWLFGGLSVLNFLISMVSIFSFISLYIYEMPTHHCPFCFLQEEYSYIGYPLYLSLFAGSILGIGAAVLNPLRHIESLSGIIPESQKKMALASIVLISIFILIVLGKMIFTDYVLDG